MFLFRGLLFRLFTLAIVVLVAAGAGWWFFIREDNQLATAAPEVPQELRSAGAPQTSSVGSQRYVIVPDQSEAAYFADEKLANLSLPSTAKGSTKSIEGEFNLTPAGLDPARPSKFTVDLRTLKSDQSRRDGQVQSRGLETAKYPTATFVAKSLSGLPETFPENTEVPLKLTGTLDLHGVQKEVTWDVKAKQQGAAFSALATLNFKYADFNIPVLTIAGVVSVQDNVTLQVSIVASPG